MLIADSTAPEGHSLGGGGVPVAGIHRYCIWTQITVGKTWEKLQINKAQARKNKYCKSFSPEITPVVSVIHPFKLSEPMRNQVIFTINLSNQNARTVAKQSDNLFPL